MHSLVLIEQENCNPILLEQENFTSAEPHRLYNSRTTTFHWETDIFESHGAFIWRPSLLCHLEWQIPLDPKELPVCILWNLPVGNSREFAI